MNDPEKSAGAIDEKGFLHSGDVGRFGMDTFAHTYIHTHTRLLTDTWHREWIFEDLWPYQRAHYYCR